MKVKIEIYADIDISDFEELKQIEHHADYLLDLENYPEIKSVYSVSVTKVEY